MEVKAEFLKSEKIGQGVYHNSDEYGSTEAVSQLFMLTNIPKQKRGRPKKNATPTYSSNNDGTVRCIICNKDIEEELWVDHNATTHYNMAWRYGEIPLDLSDDSIKIQCIKKSIEFTAKKRLNCKNCDFESSKAQEFLNHFDNCNKIVNEQGMTMCAICKQEIKQSHFNSHKLRQHNNLAWRIGDQPLAVEDQRLVLLILKKVHKLKKVLYCGDCGTSKKSVCGFLSHQLVCNKSETEVESIKVNCSLCDMKVFPSTLYHHIRSHKEKEAKEKEYSIRENTPGIEEVSQGRMKRDAAQRALDLIDASIDSNKNNSDAFQFQYNFVPINFDQSSVIHKIHKELEHNKFVKCKYKNCEFEVTNENSNNLTIILEHLKSCIEKPGALQNYVCNKCLVIREYEHEILHHIKDYHDCTSKDPNFEEYDYKLSLEDLEDMDIDPDPKLKERKRPKIKTTDCPTIEIQKNKRPKCIPTSSKKPDSLFAHAYEWHSEFREQYFSKSIIFEHLNNWEFCHVLDPCLLEHYLPSTLKSCVVSFKSVRHNLKNVTEHISTKRFELFEIQSSNNGSFTIYCGGPISALSWLPTDNSESNQILALSVLKEMDGNYKVSQTYGELSIVQFWDFGRLKNKIESNTEPAFLFGLVVDCGPIWCLEWCPSGCFNVENKRLGLLAMATSDSCVHLYAIPTVENSEQGVFYKNSPVATLKAENNKTNENNFFATKISWTKAKGHKYIAVGYSNGIVALFNLEKLENMPSTLNYPQILFPMKLFQAHLSGITALTLNHLYGGKRFALTGSLDREIVTWDLESFEKLSSSKRGIVTDGLWMTHWLNSVISFDESSSYVNSPNVTIQNIRDFLSDTGNLTNSPNTISTIEASDWLNIIVEGSAIGEISVTPVHQMLHCFEPSKNVKFKCILGYVKMEQESQSIPKLTSLYKDIVDDYTLTFVDYKLNSFKDFPRSPDEISELKEIKSDPTLYPLQKINKLACNPNLNSSIFVAAGYQAGFVRIFKMDFLKQDAQLF